MHMQLLQRHAATAATEARARARARTVVFMRSFAPWGGSWRSEHPPRAPTPAASAGVVTGGGDGESQRQCRRKGRAQWKGQSRIYLPCRAEALAIKMNRECRRGGEDKQHMVLA
jgi:hypothetical protein